MADWQTVYQGRLNNRFQTAFFDWILEGFKLIR